MQTESTDLFQNVIQNEQFEVIDNVVLGEHYKKDIAKQLWIKCRMLSKQYKVEMFDELAKLTESQDVLLQHKGIIGIRKLSADGSIEILLNLPSTRNYISTNLIDRSLQKAKQDTYKHLKSEACFLLANLSIDPVFCRLIVEKEGVELLIQIIKNQTQNSVVCNAIWCLGNISADASQYRDLVISNGGVILLIQQIKKSTKRSQIKQLLWVLENICRTSPFKKFKQISEVCQIMCEALLSVGVEQQDDNLVGILWSLCRLTDGRKAQIQTVRKSGVLRFIVEQTLCERLQVCVPSLRILGNFATGNEAQTEELISHGIFDIALCLINHHKATIRREIIWILSNIAAGSPKQKEALMSSAQLMRNLGLLLWQPQQRIKNEVLWVYSNLARQCLQPAQLIALVLEHRVLEALVKMLDEDEVKIVRDALEMLKVFLNFGQRKLINNQNLILSKVANFSITDKLQELQQHQNETIYHLALKICEQYFET